ncbi:MAG: transposase [Planctomycetota bacterium]
MQRRIARYEDEGHGQCWLRQDAIADIVEGTLLHGDLERYRLLAWCVMPNHVHGLIETLPGFSVSGLVHTWKSFSATQANRSLNREGDEFWMPDYYDRVIRNEHHLRVAIHYIENSPVKAWLIRRPMDWKHSSAGRR